MLWNLHNKRLLWSLFALLDFAIMLLCTSVLVRTSKYIKIKLFWGWNETSNSSISNIMLQIYLRILQNAVATPLPNFREVGVTHIRIALSKRYKTELVLVYNALNYNTIISFFSSFRTTSEQFSSSRMSE